MCSVYLKELIPTNNTLTTMINNEIKEQQLSDLLANLESFPSLVSEKCLAAVMPFLCQYVYPPCDDNGTTKFISQKQCNTICYEVCESEWRFAMATNFGSLLPVCEAFDINNNFSLNTKDSVNISEPLMCHYQFKEFCGVCLPLCATFSQYTDQIRMSEDIVIIIASVLAITGGIIVFFAAVVRRKEM